MTAVVEICGHVLQNLMPFAIELSDPLLWAAVNCAHQFIEQNTKTAQTNVQDTLGFIKQMISLLGKLRQTDNLQVKETHQGLAISRWARTLIGCLEDERQHILDVHIEQKLKHNNRTGFRARVQQGCVVGV